VYSYALFSLKETNTYSYILKYYNEKEHTYMGTTKMLSKRKASSFFGEGDDLLKNLYLSNSRLFLLITLEYS
jgi:hypothetical protein